MAEQDIPPPTITAMKIPIIRKGEYDIWSMRMRQYICHTDHNLWDVIVNGDLEEEPAPTGETSAPPAPKTAKQLAAKRNQERVKSILLLAIPDEYLLKFHNVADAKSLWEAIKSRFGGNEESKKMQKNVLKHQFENFTTASNESLDKAYDRFQKLISQLEVHGAPISKEDINQKFLRRLDEYAIRRNQTSESVVSNPKIDRDRVIIEDWNSDDEEEEYEVQTVRPETQTVKTRDDKSGQNSKKQGIGFRKVKACFVCKSTNHYQRLSVYASRPIYPRMDNVRQRDSCAPIKRSYYTKPASKPKDLKQDVKIFRVQNMSTAGTRAAVNTGKGKLDTDFKKSRWVWRPKGNYLDHVSKDSGLFMLKKVELCNPEILLQDHAVVDSGCSSHISLISMDWRMDRSCAANSTHIWSVNKHNMVAFLKKPNESVSFTEVVDFLKGTSLRYALTHNPTIYDSLVKQFWQTVTVRTLANGTQQLVASIDSKEYTITEASVRSKLQLADATRIHNLSDAEIYAGLATLGYVTEGDIVPLLPAMLAGAAMDQGEGSAQPAEPHPTPVDPLPSTSLPPNQSPPHSPHQSPPHSPHQSPPHSPHQSPPHSPFQSPPYSPPHSSPPRSYEAPLPEGNTSGSAEASIQLKELMVLVPSLVTRVTSLEKELKDTKQTLGNDVLKLVKKVKSLEKALKRKSKKVIMSASEGEEPEDHRRIIQDIDDDPLVSLVRESMKEKSTDFVTPTKASGEAQEEEEISPTILEAAKTLSKVASQSVSKAKSTDKGKRYRRRARSMAKKINIELDAEDEINTGRVEINSEEAGLEEAIRLQAQMDEEVAKQIHLDKMLAKRVQEEQELSEQQLKRKAEVQKAAQFYTEED
ncbi:hypothetical protein Tco_0407370 [Tanacetum coccineum]